MESFSDGKLLRLSQLHDRCVFFSYFLLLVARCCTYIYIWFWWICHIDKKGGMTVPTGLSCCRDGWVSQIPVLGSWGHQNWGETRTLQNDPYLWCILSSSLSLSIFIYPISTCLPVYLLAYLSTYLHHPPSMVSPKSSPKSIHWRIVYPYFFSFGAGDSLIYIHLVWLVQPRCSTFCPSRYGRDCPNKSPHFVPPFQTFSNMFQELSHVFPQLFLFSQEFPYYPGITLSFCKFSMTSPSSLSR